jgi:hypothetical protein
MFQKEKVCGVICIFHIKLIDLILINLYMNFNGSQFYRQYIL